jgi:hypothetical protein
MEEHDRSIRVSPEIYVYATNKNFLNVYDALRIEKIKVEIAGYDPATNRQTGCASAWLDLNDARLLSHLVAHRQFAEVSGGSWEKYGGSQREDGNVESRTLQIEYDDGGGRFAKYPYRITIANGPGKRTTTGGVSPAGEPTSRQSMRLPELDMMKVMLALGDYIRAYEAAHHHRLVAQRVREIRDKLADRDHARESREQNGRTAPSGMEARRSAAPAAPITPLRERSREGERVPVARAG